ncbi:DUF1796 family putative cysteine peptidase [Flavobacterium panacagri]|uniref:DUF1796 family putative cysteine peptidase n=1 Tax=Flavobacterium panacagri TaxID=3034146 RepID=UPI0025A58176|nr:DUF1796 family putative cysteine peptidase [Flavobacterium panacagri]
MKKKIIKTLKTFLPYGFIVLKRKYTTNKKKEFVFDAIFSIGDACRPAHYLKNHDLRLCANPLDWMMHYSLETVIHLYQSKFTDFFTEFSEHQQNSNWYLDVKNNITSIHYKNIGDDNNSFNNIMKKRFEKVNQKLLKANQICFISRRDESHDDFFDFLKKMGNIYSGKITHINIRHNQEIDGITTPIKCTKKKISEKLELIEYEFNDIHINGIDENRNPDFWLGNTHLWDEIITKIDIRRSFISYLKGNNQ